MSFRINWHILTPVLLLAAIGILVVFSASMPVAEENYNNPFFFFKRHVMYWALGAFVMFCTYRFNPEWLAKLSKVFLVLAIVAIFAVWLPSLGKVVNGSRRWIGLGGLTLQTSEFAKLFFLIYLSDYILKQKQGLQVGWHAFSRPLALLLIILIGLLAQPDFGTAAVFTATVMGVLFLAGANIKQFIALAVVVILAAISLVIMAPYRMKRVTGFLDPWNDPFGDGYQLIQSLIAFGRGGIDGVGFGNSVQKLLYLPEAQTDFAFAIWAEETGLIGNILVILLFTHLIWQIMKVGRTAFLNQNYFSANLVYGIGLIIAMQVVVNIGVCMGLLPTKGLTLPLISYGGSSLLVNCMFIGIVLRVSAENLVFVVSSKVIKKAKRKRTAKAKAQSDEECGSGIDDDMEVEYV